MVVNKTHADGKRRCHRCKQWKPFSEFNADNVSKCGGGTQRMCKICKREYTAERRAQGKGSQVNFARKVEVLREWRKRNPEKYRAHSLVAHAIRRGILVRMSCHCGKRGEAHHDDYSKPLEVSWLCRKHHAEIHRINGMEEIPYIDFKLRPRTVYAKPTEERDIAEYNRTEQEGCSITTGEADVSFDVRTFVG